MSTTIRCELFPAIDLRGGHAVRLAQGDYARQTTYSSDPIAVAESFVAAGARWVHVVDLDAARGDGPLNRSVIAKIAESLGRTGVKVQTGGGVRSTADALELFAAGVARVVIGTAAVRRPEIISEVVSQLPFICQVAVGLDAHLRSGGVWEVAVQGWTEATGLDLFDVLSRAETDGAHAVIATDISRDGMLTGPATELYKDLLARTKLEVIASGGVATPDDVSMLAGLHGLAGVIAGRAIYEGHLDVADGVRRCHEGSVS
jgi:phosphoribosylformimino-5-aminoimidazole carboxamide ribotide isomerase